MNELYAILMSWAITLSGYSAPANQPEIVMAPHSYLVDAACAGRECKVLGWFPPGETIYLDNRLDPMQSVYASSILVHELVHFPQQQSGRLEAKIRAKPGLQWSARRTGCNENFCSATAWITRSARACMPLNANLLRAGTRLLKRGGNKRHQRSGRRSPMIKQTLATGACAGIYTSSKSFQIGCWELAKRALSARRANSGASNRNLLKGNLAMKTSIVLLPIFLASTAGATLADNDAHRQAARMITFGSDISTPRVGFAVPKQILIAGEGDAQAKAAAMLNHLQPNGTRTVGGPVRVLTQVPQDGHASARDLLARPVAKASSSFDSVEPQLAGEAKASQ